jgi:hypothetical protein
MIDRDEAERRARTQIEEWLPPDGYLLLEDETRDLGFAWLFFYGSIDDSPLAGNGPVAVRRTTGDVQTIGTARPLDEYIENLRREWGE